MGEGSLRHDKNDVIYGGYVLTQEGRFYLDGSNLKAIKLADIAIAQSRKGRWSDLGRRQLTIGEHTLYVSNLAGKIAEFDGHGEEFILWCRFHGLHHDDHEAYPPGELATPCKKLLAEAENMGNLHQLAIYEKFDWPDPTEAMLAVIKEADRIAAYKEGPVLFPLRPETKNIGSRPRHHTLDIDVPHEEPNRRAILIRWLHTHRELEEKLGLDTAQ